MELIGLLENIDDLLALPPIVTSNKLGEVRFTSDITSSASYILEMDI